MASSSIKLPCDTEAIGPGYFKERFTIKRPFRWIERVCASIG
jgi:hypothetical protein